MSLVGRLAKALFTFLAALCLASCGNQSSPVSPTNAPNGTDAAGAAPTPGTGTAVLIGAGDIGMCGELTPPAELTARLIDRLAGTVFTAGDNAYRAGGRDTFMSCYEPTWGRHRGRTHPVAGNHDYEDHGDAYFSYFGETAGSGGSGYYGYNVGPWRIVALNSEVPSGAGSPQLSWLRQELSTTRSFCTAVIWHRPLFSSGRSGDNPDMREVWRMLYEFNVDVVINGHDHTYERFAPQDPDGRFDPARGIREFVVGTGGAPLYEFSTVRANSEARAAAWGVGVFTLSGEGYRWEFVPVEGGTYRDSGSGACH